MKFIFFYKRFYILSYFLGLLIPTSVFGQTSFVRLCSSPNTYVTNNTVLMPAIDFTASIPIGHVVTDVKVEVTWSRRQGSCLGTNGVDDLSEVEFSLISPTGISRPLVGPGGSFSGTGAVSNITTTFQDGGVPISGTPSTSTYNPALSLATTLPAGTDFLASQARGLWTIEVSDGSLNSTGICIQSYCITVFSCASPLLVASCRPTASIALDSFGFATPTFNTLNLLSDTSCMLSNVRFSLNPLGSPVFSLPLTCTNVGSMSLYMVLTDKLGRTAVCPTPTILTVSDVTPPRVPECQMFSTPSDTVYLNGAGTGSFNVSSLTPSDACGISSVLISSGFAVNFGSQVNFNCTSGGGVGGAGANNLFVRVRDNNGNVRNSVSTSSSFYPACQFRVLVFDTFPPVAVCHITRTLALASNGLVAATPTTINNGTFSTCSPAGALVYTINNAASVVYNCDSIGTRYAFLTARENNTAQQGGVRLDTCVTIINVVDLIAPNAICTNLTAPLSSAGSVTVSASTVAALSSDNCGPLSYSFSTGNSRTFTCANLGANVLTVTVTDQSGNNSTCATTISVTDVTAPLANCQPVVVRLNTAGNGTVTAANIDNGSTDACGITSRLINGVGAVTYNCDSVGTRNITFIISDISNNRDTCFTTVTVSDTIKPTAQCQSINSYLSVSGTATVSASQINNGSFDNCAISSLTINGLPVGTPVTYICDSVGTRNVTLRVNDLNGNWRTCQTTVNVIDTIDPIAQCQNVNAYINAAGTVSVTASQINNGSTDNCGVLNYQLFSFATVCTTLVATTVPVVISPIGTPTISSTILAALPAGAIVTDVNVLNVTGTHTYISNLRFNLTSPSGSSFRLMHSPCADENDFNINFDDAGAVYTSIPCPPYNAGTYHPLDNLSGFNGQSPSGNWTLSVADIVSGDGGALDSWSLNICYAIPTPVAYPCDSVGSRNVVLMVSDQGGNSSTCSAVISVLDSIRPVAQCQNYSIYLNATGTASLSTLNINNGSTDNCNISTIQFNGLAVGANINYNCDSVGTRSATLKVSDVNNNFSNCTASVAVIDSVKPVAVCQPITAYLSSAGTVSVSPIQINNGSTDACGISTYTINGLANQNYTCSNTGSNSATLTVTDRNGNFSSCTTSVTVLDTIRPNAVCRNITVELSAVTGTVTVTAAMVNNLSYDNCGIAAMNLGTPSITYNCSNVGTNNVVLNVTDVNGNTNFCSAVVTVRDTVDPVANCQNTIIYLTGAGTATLTPVNINNGSTDNCAISSFQLNGLSSGTNINYTCDSVGTRQVNLRVNDTNGNFSTCNSLVFVRDTVLPQAICQNINVYLNAAGTVSVSPAQINNGSNDACGIGALYINGVGNNTQLYNCFSIGTNSAVLHVIDNNNNAFTCSATVTVIDTVKPVMSCKVATLQLNSAGYAVINPSLINNSSTDACGFASLAVSRDTVRCSDIGTLSVRLIGRDVNGNIDSCSTIVTIADTIKPVAICNNLNAFLNTSGSAFVTAAQVNNGSTDNCAINTYKINGLDTVSYSCTDIGIRSLVLQVTDINGNFGICNAQVNVQDTIKPTVICQNLSLALDNNGTRVVNATSINNGSSDFCSISTLTFSAGAATKTFNCNNIGLNTVTLVVTDLSGNRDSCTATITISDQTLPNALCQSASVFVNTLGIATVLSTTINAGSSDACGIDTMYVSPSTFNCNSISAPVNITLTVIDNNNNVNTCVAPVTVIDSVRPTMICANPTVYLNATGSVSVSASVIDGGSSDACGILTRFINGTANQNYTCSNIGPNNALLSATDFNANTGTCTSIVTVVDTMSPSARCRAPFSVYLSGVTGTVTLNPIQVDSSSTDNCSTNTALYTINNQPLLSYNCANAGSTQNITLRVFDGSGNFSICTSTVYVRDTTRPIAQCYPSITRNLSSANPGTVSVNASLLNNLSTDVCGGASLSFLINGQASFQYTCANLGPTPATLTVTDPSGNSSTCNTIVIISDITPPNPSCVGSYTLNLDSTGQGNVTGANLNLASTDNCAVTTFLINGAPSQTFNCSNFGSVPATLTVRDASGNQQSCTSVITVQDITGPIARCYTNPVNVYLNAASTVTITGIQLDSASTDNCTISTRLINSAVSVSYSCLNIGLNNVTLTIRDQANNASSCTAQVIVRDTVSPTANCSNINSFLNASGLSFVNATAINSSSLDNCIITSYLINGQSRDTFNCTNIGPNIVSLTVLDNSGNESTCQSTITVIDNIAPSVICQNSVFVLDAAGQVIIPPSSVGNATDICGVVNYSIDNLQFRTYSCSSAGLIMADTIRAFDASGNSNFCVSQITILDTIRPIASCIGQTVYLDSAGTRTVFPGQINLNSSDNCSIASFLIDNQPSRSFNCGSVGPNTVTLRVLDASGNSNTCTAVITVVDDIAPVANCRNISVILDASGQATVPALSLNGSPTSSYDACNPLTFSINGQPNITFNCSNVVGTNTVQLTVSDVSGNVSTCNSSITVQDNIAPTISCTNYTLQLDASGNGLLVPQNVANLAASFDNCNTLLYALDNNQSSRLFSCSDIGFNTVMVIGSDPAGNRDTCYSTVEVKDTVAPDISCSGFIVNLTQTITDTITLAELAFQVSLEACGVDTSTFFPSVITCANVGVVPIQITTYDIYGNAGYCTAQVTVILDGALPSAIDSLLCEGEPLQLFANPPPSGFTYDYSWSGPNSFNSNNPNPQIGNMQTINQGAYVVTLIPQGIPGCTVSDTINIGVNFVPHPILSVNGPVCDQDSTIFTIANASDYTGTVFNYQWLFNGISFGTSNDTFVINPISFSDTGNYTMIITVDGCTDSSLVPLNVFVNPLPAAFSPTANSPCLGDTLSLFTNPPTVGPYTYSWSGPEGFSTFSQNPIILETTFLSSGLYMVTISDQNTCNRIGAVLVTIKALPDDPFIDYNDPLCINDFLILNDTVLRNPNTLFVWTDPSLISDTTVLPEYINSSPVEGNYSLYVIENGCISTEQLINIVFEVQPGAFFDNYEVAFRDSLTDIEVTLNDAIRDGYSISILQNANNGNLSVNTDGTLNYTPGFLFHGLDTFSYEICDPVCPTICDSAVVVVDVLLNQRCFIPNALSPNGDNINDFLIVSCREDYPKMEIQVFSRWGNMVFQGDPNGWDGQYNGANLPDGAYFYILDFGDGSKPENGYVVINR